eukprot:NODE_16984_length_967_cov_4.038095.p1 GENE.NODE_16984_length_967_cov_4.038095~~NODE_16984_length_967_cov_4.038095.p1  ORF type:complete len:242 (-),score=43.73 NODE_16984_length_967_cov_4.038095:125-850(-)
MCIRDILYFVGMLMAATMIESPPTKQVGDVSANTAMEGDDAADEWPTRAIFMNASMTCMNGLILAGMEAVHAMCMLTFFALSAAGSAAQVLAQVLGMSVALFTFAQIIIKRCGVPAVGALAAIGYVLQNLSLFAMTYNPGTPFWLLAFIYFAAGMMIAPGMLVAPSVHLQAWVPVKHIGAACGVGGVGYGIGRIFGPVIAGMLFDLWPRSPYLFYTGLQLIWLPLAPLVYRMPDTDQPKEK